MSAKRRGIFRESGIHSKRVEPLIDTSRWIDERTVINEIDLRLIYARDQS